MTEQYNNMVKKVGQLRCENDRYINIIAVSKKSNGMFQYLTGSDALAEVSLKVVLQYT